jgi:adenine-specific DNA-methyltransferase
VTPIDSNARTALARKLRRNSTEAELHLWRRLRNCQIFDWKWRRQEPIGRYFADFACREGRLVVEIDGSQHYESDGSSVASDTERSRYIQAAGWRVLRFSNREALFDTDTVLEAILQALGGARERSCW